MPRFFALSALVAAILLNGAEFARGERLKLDFPYSDGQSVPAGYRSAVSGLGAPGTWAVIMADAPSAFAALTDRAQQASRKPVLAQKARDVTDEHFPLLIYEEQTFEDFSFTAKIKTVGGAIERMAGLAFRIKDEKNYYVVRASSLGNSFRFYKFVDGTRSAPVGPNIPIPSGVWHELKVECQGNRIRCFLNGEEAIPEITDTSFIEGKVGFWTKSDSVSYFADAVVDYERRQSLAESIVQDIMRENPRLIGVALFAPREEGGPVEAIAASDPSLIGRPAGKAEADVYARGVTYYGKLKSTALVTLPLDDRNGDIIAAARFEIKAYPGQIDRVAIARVQPILQRVERKALRAKDLRK